MAKSSKRKKSDNRESTDRMPQEAVKSEDFFRKPIVHILIIVILGALIYSNTFHVPFVFDDASSIVDNSAIRDVHQVTGPQNTYKGRVITQLTFALSYKMNGLNVAGYHIFNLVIHLLTALLVYWLIILTSRTPYVSACLQKNVLKTFDFYHWIPLFTALLFVSHPVQTQAVTYTVQRFTSLATLFYLFSLVMYIKARSAESPGKTRYAFYGASIISAVLAMWTKEIAFTLPVMIALYEFMFYQGDIKKRMLYLLPLLLTMLIIPLSLMSYDASKGVSGIDELTKMAGSVDVSRWDYLNTQFRVIVTYIRLLFFPLHQNLDYDYPIYRTFFTPPVFLSFLFLLGTFCWGIYLLYRSNKSDQANRFWHRLIAFGIFWFFVTLSVESSIFPIKDIIFEHRLYLPSVGFFMAIMSAIAFICVRLVNQTKGLSKVLIPVMILIVISLSLTAYARNMVWQDEVTLWEDVIKKSPHKERPHNNLGTAYAGHGKIDAAIAHFQKVLEINPNNAQAYYNLGNAMMDRGQVDAAIAHYRKALEIKPDYAEANNNLGNALGGLGQVDAAIAHFQKALEINPNHAKAHNNLGNAMMDRGQIDAAIAHYQKALEINPDFTEAHNNLGNALRGRGQVDAAIAHYQKALEINPNYAEAHNNLGNALTGIGKIDAAIPHFQKALEVRPDYAKAHYNLGNVLMKRGQVDAAIIHFQKALESNPNYAEAHYNLGIASVGRGQVDAAIAHYQKALEIKPDYAEAHINLGIALAGRRQVDAAIAHYRKALEIKPDCAEAHTNLGNTFAGRGQVDTAIAHYRKALEINPNLVDTHFNLGIALMGRGQVDAAIAHFQKVLEIKPDDAEARSNLDLALRHRGQLH